MWRVESLGTSLEATDGGRMEAVGMVGKEQRGQSGELPVDNPPKWTKEQIQRCIGRGSGREREVSRIVLS